MMKQILKAMKDLQSSEMKSARKEIPFDHRSYFGHAYSLDANGLDVGVSEARSGLVRRELLLRILMLIYGWKIILINSRVSLTPRKFTLMRLGNYLFIMST